MSTTKQPGAKLRSASRRRRQLGVTLAALICAISLAGCGPPLTFKVVSFAQGIEGGCGITVDASGLAQDPTIGIGMFFTNGSPVLLGVVTANSAGVINNRLIEYSAGGFEQTYSNLNAGLYDVTRGSSGSWQFQTGLPLISVPVTIKACPPPGLKKP